MALGKAQLCLLPLGILDLSPETLALFEPLLNFDAIQTLTPVQRQGKTSKKIKVRLNNVKRKLHRAHG